MQPTDTVIESITVTAGLQYAAPDTNWPDQMEITLDIASASKQKPNPRGLIFCLLVEANSAVGFETRCSFKLALVGAMLVSSSCSRHRVIEIEF